MKKVKLIAVAGVVILSSLAGFRLIDSSEDRIVHEELFSLYTPLVGFYPHPGDGIMMMSFSIITDLEDTIYVNNVSTKDSAKYVVNVYEKNYPDPKVGEELSVWLRRNDHATRANGNRRVQNEYNKGVQKMIVTNGIDTYRLHSFIKDFRKDNQGTELTLTEAYKTSVTFYLKYHPGMSGKVHEGGTVHKPGQ